MSAAGGEEKESFNRAPAATAAERNREPIKEVMLRYLDPSTRGVLVEIAAGFGVHAQHIAPSYPDLTWQTTEINEDSFAQITQTTASCTNVPPPQVLDVSTSIETWPEAAISSDVAAILVVNLTHISPWICTLNVLQGAASKLRPSGLLLIYGPFAIDGEPQGEGNIKFDASLRSKNDEWGYRDRDVVFQEGERFGLERVAAEAMPADNHFLIMRRPSL